MFNLLVQMIILMTKIKDLTLNCLIVNMAYKIIFLSKHMQASDPLEIILPSTHSQRIIQSLPPIHEDPVSNKKHIAERLNEHIISNIQDQIIESKISFSPSNINPHHQISRQKESPSLKLHEIVKKKKQLNEEITRLKYEESRVKDEHHQKSIDRMTRSEFTKEEHQQIAKALQAQKQLEQEIQLKNKRLQQALEQKRLQKQAQIKAKMQEKCKQKQKKIVQNLKDLSVKKEERDKQIKQLNKKYQSVKNRSFLHEKMEASWKDLQKKHQEEDKEVLTTRKKVKEFSINSIIQHEKKYKTFVNNVSKEKQQKLKQAKLQKERIQKQVLNHYQPSHFLQTIFEEEKKLKQTEQERNSLVRFLAQTKNKYGNTVRQLNRQQFQSRKSLPPIKQRKLDEFNNVQEANLKNKDKLDKFGEAAKAYRSMSRLQIAQIGNKYLREVHSSLGHTDSKPNQLKTGSQQLKQPQQQAYKYQDYLQDLKKKRAEKPINPQLKEISELKKVLKKNSNAQDKLYYAKLIAGRLQNKAKSNTNMLVSSINAKLAILNQFSQ